MTKETPPCFVWTTGEDNAVPPENSRLMYKALQKAGVTSALHEYPVGGHGFGYTAPPHEKKPIGWLEKAGEWLKGLGFME